MTLRGWDTEGMPEIDRDALIEMTTELLDEALGREGQSVDEVDETAIERYADAFIEQQSERWRS